MGTRGPVPKRTEQLHGHRSKDELAGDNVTKAAGATAVSQPPAPDDWHPIAVQLWEAMGESGQARFYEPSDWAIAYSLMDDLSYYKNGVKRSGQMLQTIMSSLSSLLLTEGDRRRLQIELARPVEDEGDDSKVVVMDKWRKRLS